MPKILPADAIFASDLDPSGPSAATVGRQRDRRLSQLCTEEKSSAGSAHAGAVRVFRVLHERSKVDEQKLVTRLPAPPGSFPGQARRTYALTAGGVKATGGRFGRHWRWPARSDTLSHFLFHKVRMA